MSYREPWKTWKSASCKPEPRYIRSGHGYVGIHAAADTEYGWPWYGKLVGAYFRNHPNGTPTATVVREHATHPSTAHLPERWTRVDEWYNYQSPENPNPGGGGTDYSARNTPGVKVLLTMDESTYAEADGSDGGCIRADWRGGARRRRPACQRKVGVRQRHHSL